jgi:hypothetical protein
MLRSRESIDEILERVRRGKDFLDKQASDAASLRQANPHVQIAESVLEPKRGPNSIFGDAGSVIGDREFDFDNIIVNSKAYRRAMAIASAAVSRRSPGGASNARNSQSIMNLANVSFEIRDTMPPTKTPEAPDTMADVLGSGSHVPSSLPAERLQVGVPQPSETQLGLEEALINERKGHEETKKAVQELQRQLLSMSQPMGRLSQVLTLLDIDYFDHQCQQLCVHIQQWVLRFSKFSDMKSCRLTSEISDEKIVDRLDNTALDGSNPDSYLQDRVKRRDVFMSLVTVMIWEFIFTRYLFGTGREQRQRLKSLEKTLSEVGPPSVVREWRAVTLTLMATREVSRKQRSMDVEAVVQSIAQTLFMILPPPSHLEDQIESQLRRLIDEAVDLSIAMRTQQAEYMMLPPLQPEYDANGDLVDTVPFNAALMNCANGSGTSASIPSNEELEEKKAVVKILLFPLVIRRGNDQGEGEDEIVVCPAQVLVQDKYLLRAGETGNPSAVEVENE